MLKILLMVFTIIYMVNTIYQIYQNVHSSKVAIQHNANKLKIDINLNFNLIVNSILLFAQILVLFSIFKNYPIHYFVIGLFIITGVINISITYLTARKARH